MQRVNNISLSNIPVHLHVSMERRFGFFILFYTIHSVILIKGEIRCHCNESGCISTGYMCKSRLGMCYSLLQREEMDINENTLSVHGCAENLRTAHRDLCSDNSKGQSNDIIRTSTSLEGEFSPLLLCCKKDMCNYEKNMRSVQFATNTQSNGSIQRGRKQNHMSHAGSYTERHDNGDLWFKAAVIAVPIAGAFILTLLVLIAVRMLRTDNKRHRRLVVTQRDRGLTKAQLYVADHFSEKCDRVTTCPSFAEKAASLYKDVNTKMDRDGKIYERVNEKDILQQHQHQQQQLSPSVIVWGEQPKRNFATVV